MRRLAQLETQNGLQVTTPAGRSNASADSTAATYTAPLTKDNDVCHQGNPSPPPCAAEN